MYKFEGEESENPKGVPIPVEAVNAALITENGETLIELRTIRKHYILKGNDRDDCVNWINAINERKRLSIKERLGHAPLDAEVGKMNRIGDSLFEAKIKQEAREGREISDRGATMNPMFAY